MYSGTCCAIIHVHLDAVSITVLYSCRKGAILMIVSLNASDLQSRAIPDLTGYIEVIAEATILALSDMIFLIVTSDCLCQW